MITSDFVVYKKEGQLKEYKPIYKYQNGVNCLYCGSKMKLVKLNGKNMMNRNQAMFECTCCGVKCYNREYNFFNCRTITPVADFILASKE